jgi:hypothetical protein
VKRVFGRITAAILISASLAACGPSNNSASATGDIKVMAPLNSEGGEYKLSFTELIGISDLTTLAGKFVKFFLSPRVINNHLEGSSPRTRFVRNSDGIYVPADDSTMQMVTIYAHMQKLAALDDELGASGVNKWPRDVGVAVRVAGNLRNNAFYEGKTDSMLVVPYTNKNLPIAVNGGILAHEHFHSLFYKMVLADQTATVHAEEIKEVLGTDFSETLSGTKTRETPSSLSESDLNYYYHVALTRGLNEGLADFWGWMYTGDTNFIAHSLPSEQKRNLKVTAEEASGVLSSESRIKGEINNRFIFSKENEVDFNSLINSYAYTLGTEFSRSMKRYTDLYATAHGLESQAARKEVAKVIVKMLPNLRADLSKSEQEVFTAKNFVESFVKNTKMSSSGECEYLAGLLNAAQSMKTPTFSKCRQEGEEWHIVTETSLSSVSAEPIKAGIK